MEEHSKTWFILAVLAAVFVFVPYLANLIYICLLPRIMKELCAHNHHALVWLRENAFLMAVFVVISGGVHAALELVS